MYFAYKNLQIFADEETEAKTVWLEEWMAPKEVYSLISRTVIMVSNKVRETLQKSSRFRNWDARWSRWVQSNYMNS